MLPAAWCDRATVEVARDLLGMLVVHRVDGAWRAGRIVETEAYLGRDDPASHAWGGRTPSRVHLFGTPGTIYVYRSYGVHWCANVVTAPRGHGSAVLLRALEPIVGLEAMVEARGLATATALASGPGKLCQALAISDAHDGGRWWRGPLTLRAGTPVPDAAVRVTPRIGITRAVEAPLRFAVADSPHVSHRATLRASRGATMLRG